ncbi:DUF2577 domain-containing protein [Paenibacillus timonensis]|uniref:DUF2577 family protein n=1 Tax=Paenibacillus timonensis TaxID=225915 RepID=A0ABW3SG63_9BACL|nr:DUF2577 family protein [Paenibacillus timonensis]MCH1642053.1 DUF2577 domain-containing protein [Paenibacillus timonensis]GJM79399.1 hypothetical protein HMSSN139_18950 [Paenibacillus sp. HMSSN-139]
MERIEGSGASQLVQLIRTIGYNSEITFELATVTSAPPQLKIKVDHMNVELEKDDLIVAQSLTSFKRKINLTSKGKTEVSSTSPSVGFEMLPDGNGQINEISFSSIGLASADQTIKEAELEFLDELKKDDRVIVVGINQGQTYLILDRAVMY